MKTLTTILAILTFSIGSISAQQSKGKNSPTKKAETKVAGSNNDKNNPFKKVATKDSMPITITLPDASGKTRLLPSMIVPAALIIYGVSTIGNHGLYSSEQARTDIQKQFGGSRSQIDDYLQYAPYAEFAALLLFKNKCKNDMINTSLLILKSEVIMLGIVTVAKRLSHQERPDGSDYMSMPSGHTAEAFLAATIVYREYRYKSVWYGVGAYAFATTVAAFRMINDKHWQSDVLVGAGVGILAVNLVYATHLHRWGRKEVCVVPTYDGKYKGVAMVYNF